MAKTILSTVVLLITVSSCAQTSITPTAKNRAIIITSAAPACGRSGAAEVASKMAAVATIRQGFDRYKIADAASQDNTRVVQTLPTYSTTTSSAQVYGNNIYGNSTTSYGGGGTFLTGRQEAALEVVMYNLGDSGFEDGIDAKVVLGEEWEKIASEGIEICS